LKQQTPARPKNAKERKKGCPIRLKRTAFIMFIISLICGVMALLPILGPAIVALPIASFWLMIITCAVLMAGLMLRGL
jgi:hypothetical protein